MAKRSWLQAGSRACRSGSKWGCFASKYKFGHISGPMSIKACSFHNFKSDKYDFFNEGKYITAFTCALSPIHTDNVFRAAELMNLGYDFVEEKDKILFPIVEKGNHIILKELVSKKPIDLNVQNSKGETVVHAAVRASDKIDFYKITNLLFNYGAYIDLPNKEGCTPLSLAATRWYKAIKPLVDLGANIHDYSLTKPTPLGSALKDPGAKMHCFKELLFCGLDPAKTKFVIDQLFAGSNQYKEFLEIAHAASLARGWEKGGSADQEHAAREMEKIQSDIARQVYHRISDDIAEGLEQEIFERKLGIVGEYVEELPELYS